ncbi:MAG: hypothetical protein ABIM76_03625 [candidate division WOR-3 bacterium]
MKVFSIKEKILKSLNNMDFDEEIFLDVFKFQYDNNKVYKKFCDRFNKDKSKVKNFEDIPLMPVRFFKKYEVRSIKEKGGVIFLSSGTSEFLRSKSFYVDTEFINRSILISFKHFVLPDDLKTNFYIFFEPFEKRNNSSLSYMLSLVAKNFSKNFYFVFDRKDYKDALKKMKREKKKIVLLGTTLSLYDFAIFLKENNEKIFLKEGSRIMDTGGWKTKRILLKEKNLIKIYKEFFNIDESYVINEYGMCEIASQFYDITLRKFIFENKKVRFKSSLPFLRFRILNEEGKFSNKGLIAIYDLFNLETCSFLLTPDMGKIKGKGFEIIERVDEELRGCALISESILFN